MAISVASLGTSTATTNTPTLSLSGLSAGDAMVIAITTRFTSQTVVTAPSGWTAGPDGVGAAFNCYTYYKISDGTETSVSAVLVNSNLCQITGVKATGFAGTATLEGTPGEDETYLGTPTSSGGFGSTTPTSADSVIIAVLASDSHLSPEATVSGYTHTVNNSVNNGNAEIFTRILTSASTQTPTWSSTDTDEAYGAIFAFGDVTSGSNNTISVPLGGLTLTGFAPTVTSTANQLIAVPSGNLSLTGFAPTVLNGANQVIQVPVGQLVLTGHAPTVVSTANQTIAVPAGSLVITGYEPTVRVGNDQIVVVPAGALNLTGFAPTVVTTNNKFISVPVGTLILTGYAPTVLGGEVITKGGRNWTESERKLNERLRRLALQQARWEDDEEALAILLASIIRR